MSKVEENRRVIRDAFEAWQAESTYIAAVFADDMRWRIEGRSLAAGTYDGKHAFVEEVLRPFGARFGTSEPFRPTRIRSLHADGDAVIVLWDGRGVATDGVPYENTYAWFLRMRDGLVVGGTAFFDAKAFDELWTRVRPDG